MEGSLIGIEIKRDGTIMAWCDCPQGDKANQICIKHRQEMEEKLAKMLNNEEVPIPVHADTWSKLSLTS